MLFLTVVGAIYTLLFVLLLSLSICAFSHSRRKPVKGEPLPFLKSYEYPSAKQEWLIKHTDSLFGRPNDDPYVHYFEKARSSWDGKVVLNEYRVPFKFSRTGTVKVFTDEFPLHDQKFIFEWMVENMKLLSADITRVLKNSTDEETCSHDELQSAFDPSRITRISMSGSGPVAWTIHFDTDIGEGEALVGTVLGKDQRVESAEVGYG